MLRCGALPAELCWREVAYGTSLDEDVNVGVREMMTASYILNLQCRRVRLGKHRERAAREDSDDPEHPAIMHVAWSDPVETSVSHVEHVHFGSDSAQTGFEEGRC